MHHFNHFAALTLAAALLGGCPETTSCGEGEQYSPGTPHCVPRFDAGDRDAELLDAGPDAEQDAGPCNGECALDFCDLGSNSCLECRVSMSNDDCTEPAAPVCDEGECVTCTTDADCDRFTVLAPECGPAGCVACTVDNEAEVCPGFTCNPSSGRCTDVPPGDVGTCEPCVADSQCDVGFHCVPMRFEETERGGRCLQLATPGCEPPFTEPITMRRSASGVVDQTYCGIEEALTTCEAVLALTSATRCRAAKGEMCPTPGSLCGTVGLTSEVCTYPCDDSLQCPAGRTCPAGAARFCQ